jgi:hypothetical protein
MMAITTSSSIGSLAQHMVSSNAESVCVAMYDHAPGARTSRPDDNGPVRCLLGGMASPATFSIGTTRMCA